MKQKNTSIFSSRAARWVAAPLGLAVLAACGGGGGDDPAPQPVVKHVLTGQVAVGALVSGATVSINCFTGGSTANVTSGANGNFEITLSEGSTLPCVGQATLPGTTDTMRSVIPGGTPNFTRINFTPLTDSFTSYLLGGTSSDVNANPTALIGSNANLFTQLINSRLGFDNAFSSFTTYIVGNTGISLSGFNFLSSQIVVGQPSDNALEDLRNLVVLSVPSDPTSPTVPFLNPNGSVSSAGRNNVNYDANTTLFPIVVPACGAAGNTCGGVAGREVVITGGGGN